MSTPYDVQVKNEILEIEALRCRSLVEEDLATLERLLSDDLVYVHATGIVDGKPAYLALLREKVRFLAAVRERLDICIYDGLAVATGSLAQSIEIVESGQRVDMRLMTTQVWRHHESNWKLVNFQATKM